MGPNGKTPVWSLLIWWSSSHTCAANFDLSKYPCLMFYSCSFILTPNGMLVLPIHSLPRLCGILNIHCGLSLNSIFGFIFHKRPLWFFFWYTVFVLNLFPNSFEFPRQSFNVWNWYHAYWFTVITVLLSKLRFLTDHCLSLITPFITCGGWVDSKCRYPVCVGFLYTVIFNDVLPFINNTRKNGIATSSSFSMVNFNGCSHIIQMVQKKLC